MNPCRRAELVRRDQASFVPETVATCSHALPRHSAHPWTLSRPASLIPPTVRTARGMTRTLNRDKHELF